MAKATGVLHYCNEKENRIRFGRPLALIACIGSIILFNFNDHTVTVTVTDNVRIVQNNDSRYLI